MSPEEDDRIARVEALLAEVRTSQDATLMQLRVEGEAQRDELRELGAELRKTLLEQSTSILAVSTNLTKLRSEIMKWTAAGALVGAVALFIAVRALGF